MFAHLPVMVPSGLGATTTENDYFANTIFVLQFHRNILPMSHPRQNIYNFLMKYQL